MWCDNELATNVTLHSTAEFIWSDWMNPKCGAYVAMYARTHITYIQSRLKLYFMSWSNWAFICSPDGKLKYDNCVKHFIFINGFTLSAGIFLEDMMFGLWLLPSFLSLSICLCLCICVRALMCSFLRSPNALVTSRQYNRITMKTKIPREMKFFFISNRIDVHRRKW